MDKSGVIIFEREKTNGLRKPKKVFLHKKYQNRQSKGGQFFGLFASRRGELGTYTEDRDKGHMLVWIQNVNGGVKEMKIRECPINFDAWDDEYLVGKARPQIR